MVLVFYMSSYVALHFCKASRKSLKPFSSYRKGKSIWLGSFFTIPKGDNSKSGYFRVMILVFCTSYHGDIHLHKVSRKYLKQFSSYRVGYLYHRNHYFQCSEGHNSKIRLNRVTVLVFLCTSSHDALHLCEVFIKIFEMVSNLQSWYEYLVEKAIFSIYYDQRVITAKVG